MKRMFLLPALAVAAVVLAACDGPEFVSSPMSEPGQVTYDERLIGTWYIVDHDHLTGWDGASGTLITSPGREGFLDVVGTWTGASMVSSPEEETVERYAEAAFSLWRWAAHASVIDGETYFNARLVDLAGAMKEQDSALELDHEVTQWASHPERGYWIVRADISEDDLLTLHVLTEGDLGLVSRNIDCGDGACDFPLVDVSSEDLVAAIRAAKPGQLFTEQFRFARVEGTYPPQPEE